jgi:hypothetical protein
MVLLQPRECFNLLNKKLDYRMFFQSPCMCSLFGYACVLFFLFLKPSVIIWI